VSEPGGRLTTYTYNAAGDRASETVVQGGATIARAYAYNGRGWLTSVTEESGAKTTVATYRYDGNGNRTSMMREETEPANGNQSGALSHGSDYAAYYGYDGWDNMVASATGAGTAEYSYDGAGLRYGRRLDGGAMVISLYEYDRVILEVDGGTGAQVAATVHGNGPVSRNGQQYMRNGRGDITAVLDAGGAVIASYRYDAFGVHTATTGGADNPYRYAGYHYDGETGLYWLKSRYYDAETARFLGEDTYRGSADDPLSLNLYAYVRYNPMRYTDPSGHRAVVTPDQRLTSNARLWNEQYSPVVSYRINGGAYPVSGAGTETVYIAAGNAGNAGNAGTVAGVAARVNDSGTIEILGTTLGAANAVEANSSIKSTMVTATAGTVTVADSTANTGVQNNGAAVATVSNNGGSGGSVGVGNAGGAANGGKIDAANNNGIIELAANTEKSAIDALNNAGTTGNKDTNKVDAAVPEPIGLLGGNGTDRNAYLSASGTAATRPITSAPMWNEDNGEWFELKSAVESAGGKYSGNVDNSRATVSIYGLTINFSVYQKGAKWNDGKLYIQADAFYSTIVDAATEMVFMGTHFVNMPINFTDSHHSCAIMFVGTDSSYWDDGRFIKNEKWGIRYATIGGESGIFNSFLTGKVNRDSDVTLSTKVEMQWLHSGVGKIEKLFAAEENYRNNTRWVWDKLPYTFYPTDQFGYNSNSYARGILESVGLNPKTPSHNSPGWNQIIPAKKFK